MASIPARRTLGQLWRQGWNEIPEVLASTVQGLVGVGLIGVGLYRYIASDGDNRRYKSTYVIMRPDDPRVSKIKK